MIVCVHPTRGLSFTRVEMALDKIRETFDIKVLRSHDLSIPECFNRLVDEALLQNPDHLLFLEEDIILPLDKMKDMVNANVDIAFVDYGVNGYSCSAQSAKGEILWCGVGATLVKRAVFERMEKPYFRTDKSLRLNDGAWIDNTAKYGGQDIWFFTKAREKGYKIHQISGECEHLQLHSLGTREVNNGFHQIGIKDPIKQLQIIDI